MYVESFRSSTYPFTGPHASHFQFDPLVCGIRHYIVTSPVCVLWPNAFQFSSLCYDLNLLSNTKFTDPAILGRGVDLYTQNKMLFKVSRA